MIYIFAETKIAIWKIKCLTQTVSQTERSIQTCQDR